MRGLKCPMPALLARRALANRAPGTVLSVVADDPLAYVDVPHMCHEEGHTVLESVRNGDVSRFLLRRGSR